MSFGRLEDQYQKLTDRYNQLYDTYTTLNAKNLPVGTIQDELTDLYTRLSTIWRQILSQSSLSNSVKGLNINCKKDEPGSGVENLAKSIIIKENDE